MKFAAVLFLLLFAVQSCSQSDDVTDFDHGCASGLLFL